LFLLNFTKFTILFTISITTYLRWNITFAIPNQQLMINKIKIILLLALIHFSAQAQQRYQLDTKKSRILWKVETVGRHNGYLLFNKGTLDYSSKGEPSTGDFTMDMKSIRSTDRPTAAGRQEVDKELTTAGFFDTGAYPNCHHVCYTHCTHPSTFRLQGKRRSHHQRDHQAHRVQRLYQQKGGHHQRKGQPQHRPHKMEHRSAGEAKAMGFSCCGKGQDDS
jgi:hypothetical protein